VRLPGFEFGIPHPDSAYRQALLARFPAQRAAIDAWLADCHQARRSAVAQFALHGMPALLAWGYRRWQGAALARWADMTLAQRLAAIDDPLLRAVLGARWGDHGAPPDSAPFAEHALVTGSYGGGAFFPVGGPARFAQTLLPPVLAAGGDMQLGRLVDRIVVRDGRVSGVTYLHGGQRHSAAARTVISAMGAANTVACLAPAVAPDWQQAIAQLQPSVACLCLYLGLEGDIAAAGASSANHWIYESGDIGALWRDPVDEDAPGLFVSFPSLKDPGAGHAPTAEVLAFADAAPFARWLAQPDGERPEAYLALKDWIAQRLLAQFGRHFPALAPMVRFHELSTPLTQRHYVRAPQGATYGIEMSTRRMSSPALHARTPVPGLLLAGQDVVSPGIEGAFMGGLMAAACADPALWGRMRA
jgi:all-trans-retinol 13,14-reductase